MSATQILLERIMSLRAQHELLAQNGSGASNWTLVAKEAEIKRLEREAKK